MRIRPAHAAIVLLVFTGLAVVWTWPLTARLSSRVPHDPGDPILNTWILWWNAQQVPLTSAWWNAPFLVPLPDVLTLSEHLLGLSVFATPLQLAGASPLVAYNISMLLSYALSGFFAYLLAFRLTGSMLAAACAGMAFAFAPYRAGQVAHIQVLTSQWMPAMLLGMHGYLDTGRKPWLILFGLSWLLQALSNGYYMLFLPVLIALWIAWFTDWRAPRRSLTLMAAWVVGSLPLLPVLLKYYQVHSALGLSRSLADIRQFSATLASFTDAPYLLALWPAGDGPSAEHHLFPGLTVVVLTVAGLLSIVFRRQLRAAIAQRSPLLFYPVAAVLMYALTLGPGGDPGGPPSLLRPYAWLMWLPGYNGLRVPARFAMLGELCLAVAASLTVATFLRRRAHPTAQTTRGGDPGSSTPPRWKTRGGDPGAWWRLSLGCLALIGISADGLMERLPVAVPPQRIVFEGSPDATVIEIPPDVANLSAAAMYRSMFHRQPLVNGYTGYTPYHYAILSLALWRGDSSVLFYLAQERPLAIVVNYEADPGQGFRKMIAEIPGVEPRGISGAGALFLMPQQPRRHSATDGYSLPARISDAGGKRVVADLGEARTVMAIEFALRGRYKELAERVLIEVADDGQQWRQAWLGWTGEFAFDAALRDSLVAPVRIPIPETRARFVRFYPAQPWMLEELRVSGR